LSPIIKQIELSSSFKLSIISLVKLESKNLEIPPENSLLFTLNQARPFAPKD